MWVFMKLIKILRERNQIEDTAELYCQTTDGLFISLSENKESNVTLKNQGKVTYQKVIQKNSAGEYYSYTQRMIPDITIELQGKLYILDPKYRVDSNIPNALAEMHKYRDGILRKVDDSRAVEEVYIVVPAKGDTRNDMYIITGIIWACFVWGLRMIVWD
jgi:predicted component of viral defense system (DUF524 family)